ncbi:MAG: inositol monophosphatase [Lachnospiraceae bacterium]|nr:inositol monophosphatase [Lachnospiraceae bacterium]MDE6979794.1 inositol monophosphatase [Lachnospiraceae bacterium]
MLEQIMGAVRECSKIILEAENIKNATSSKLGHANFVTKYDKCVQHELFERLGKILPEAAFMGEEEVGKRFTKEGYLFVVDPIDGTTNFIKGYHASTISVGLLKDGEPVLGVVYNPYRDEMYTAQKGKGAFLNGTPIHVSEDTLSESLVLFGTAPYYEELWERSFNLAQVLFTQSLDVRRSGSATIDLCDVASGRAGVYFELRLSPWDYAAASLIVEEAGGHVRGAEGEPLQFANPQGVIACGGKISIDALLQIMDRVE